MPRPSTSAAVATAFFASVNIRSFESIFEGGVIPHVIRGGSTREVNPSRFMRAAMVVGFALLNAVALVRPVMEGRRAHADLAARAWSGGVSGDWGRCDMFSLIDDDAPGATSAWSSSNVFWSRGGAAPGGGTCASSTSACDCVQADVEALCECGLVWTEFLMLAATLAACARHLYPSARHALLSKWRGSAARAPHGASDELGRWVQVGHSVACLETCGSVSAMRILPLVKEAPAGAVARYKILRAKLTEDDGILSLTDKFWASLYLIYSLGGVLLVALAGVVALYLKLDAAANTMFDRPLSHWGSGRWVAFLGLANQIASLVPLYIIRKKVARAIRPSRLRALAALAALAPTLTPTLPYPTAQAFLHFVFTGEDAEMSSREERAQHEFLGELCKHSFRCATGTLATLRGAAAVLSIDAIDLQRIVISEKATLPPRRQSAPAQSTPAQSAPAPGMTILHDLHLENAEKYSPSRDSPREYNLSTDSD